MTDSKIFQSWREAQLHLQSLGYVRGDPLTQDVLAARRAQTEYLLYLAQEDVRVGEQRDVQIEGPHGSLQVRLLMPTTLLNATPILYLRGGGWWVGNLETSARTMACICQASGMPVIGVDYKLAPEHRFPVQLDEVVAAGQWICQEGRVMGIDPSHGLVMWGESAGATLAVCAARVLAQQGVVSIGHVLHYGNFLGPHPGLRPVSRWVWQQYLRDSNQEPPERTMVFVKSGLAGVQRAWLGCGTEDELLIDTQTMQRELRNAGIPHTVDYTEGMPHGFIAMGRFLPLAQTALESAAVAAYNFACEAHQSHDTMSLDAS